jgi:hypothetical protein
MGTRRAFVLGASCSTGLGRAFAFASEHGALDLEAYDHPSHVRSYASTRAIARGPGTSNMLIDFARVQP